MRDQLLAALVLSLGIVSAPSSQVSSAEEREAHVTSQSSGAASDALQLMQVFDTVLQHHLSPPTRQAMVHDAIREIYRRRERAMPATIAGELSETFRREDFLAILERELKPLGDLGSDGVVNRLPHRLDLHGVIVLPSKTHAVNQQVAANRYVGIGITIAGSSGLPQMHAIFEGGSAEQAGAREGDVIVEVAGESTKGRSLESVIDSIRGPEGTDVEVVVNRGGELRTLTMNRAVVPLKTIESPILSGNGRAVGIKIDRLSASNVHELRKIEDELDSKIEIVVLDFRTGSGAENLHYGELLGNALIDDAVMGNVIDRDGKARTIRAEPGALFGSKRRFVVISERTGPALKWIAAALQDAGQAKLVGTPAIQGAMVMESFSIPAGTVTVSVPTQILARASGEPLSPATGSLFESSPRITDALQGIGQVANPNGGMPGYRSSRVQGIVYPDEILPQPMPSSVTTGRVRQRFSVNQSLNQIVERLDRSNEQPGQPEGRPAETESVP
jgi:C-terminal peptidase prc